MEPESNKAWFLGKHLTKALASAGSGERGRSEAKSIADLALDFSRRNSMAPDEEGPSTNYLAMLKQENARLAAEHSNHHANGSGSSGRTASTISTSSNASGQSLDSGGGSSEQRGRGGGGGSGGTPPRGGSGGASATSPLLAALLQPPEEPPMASRPWGLPDPKRKLPGPGGSSSLAQGMAGTLAMIGSSFERLQRRSSFSAVSSGSSSGAGAGASSEKALNLVSLKPACLPACLPACVPACRPAGPAFSRPFLLPA